MSEFVDEVFVNEISKQCEYALIARAAVGSNPLSAQHAFFYLHSFLSHAGNASKLLWPSSDDTAAMQRGARLRIKLDIGDTHPLASRTLRNHLEHFDERLDHWAKSLTDETYIDQIVGDAGRILVNGKAQAALRHYNPRTDMFSYRGKEFDLKRIADGCVDVKARADKIANAMLDPLPSRFPCAKS